MSIRRLGAWGGMGLLALTLPLAAQSVPAAPGGAGGDGGFAAGVPVAPQFPFVTLDQARFFSETQYGQRLLAELAERQAELAAENRRIEAQLAERERLLTTERPKLSPEAFRTLSDRFNTEVERHRQEQATKERELYQNHERDRALFQDLSNQALAGLLRDIGAVAIIAEEAIVLGFRDIDVTAAAIARLDALVGDGTALPQPEDGPADAGAGPEDAGPEGAGALGAGREDAAPDAAAPDSPAAEPEKPESDRPATMAPGAPPPDAKAPGAASPDPNRPAAETPGPAAPDAPTPDAPLGPSAPSGGAGAAPGPSGAPPGVLRPQPRPAPGGG